MFNIVQLSTDRKEIVGVVAGTFDKLHVAHEKLISEAFKNADYVIIGVMSDRKLSNKIAWEKIDPYMVRVKYVKDLCTKLTKMYRAKRFEIVEISGPYDVVLERKEVDLLVVSEETLPRGIKINILRSRRGWKTLKLIVIPIMKTIDNRPITSHRIRLNEIDKQGNLKVKMYTPWEVNSYGGK